MILLSLRFLHEIKFEDSRSAKSSIFAHLDALNFDFCEYLHFLLTDIFTKSKQDFKP